MQTSTPTFKGHVTVNTVPDSTEWITLLDTTANVIIGQIMMMMSGGQDNMEIEILIDGVTLLGRKTTPVLDREYYVTITGNDGSVFTGLGSGLQLWVADEETFFKIRRLTSGLQEFLKGRSVRIRVRKITDNNSGTLKASCYYSQFD